MLTDKMTLIVWEEVPEETRLYLIPDPPDWLAELHGLFINNNAEGEKLDWLSRLSDALCTEREHCADPDDLLATEWADHRVAQDAALVLDLAHVKELTVVVCGFVM